MFYHFCYTKDKLTFIFPAGSLYFDFIELLSIIKLNTTVQCLGQGDR